MASRDHSIECEWQGPMWNDCGGCNWIRREAGLPEGPASGRRYCALHCAIAEETLRMLASNLAIGAGLCAAFEQGDEYAMEREALYEQRMAPRQRKQLLANLWRPGHAITSASAQMEENGE